MAMEAQQLYVIREAPGKGLGVFAAVNIPKGTRILVDTPVLRLPNDLVTLEQSSRILLEQIPALSEQEKTAFYALHNAFPEERFVHTAIFRSNGLPLGPEGGPGGLFLVASRINHTCIPNVHHNWNEHTQRLTVHAMRDIEEGEEITMSYLGEWRNREFRQRALFDGFRFTCTCQLCSLSSTRREESDARLEAIHRLESQSEIRTVAAPAPLQALREARKLLSLFAEEFGSEQHIVESLVPRAYHNAYKISISHRDIARAKVFAERAVQSAITLVGEDDPVVDHYKDLMEDATLHSWYGSGSAWSTSVDQIPSDLSAADFEAWLWKENHQQSTQVAGMIGSLRDGFTFPAFASLPLEFSQNLDYFVSLDSPILRPRRHWCFLAEIVAIEHFLGLRLVLKLQDKSGQIVPLAFYTDAQGIEFKHRVRVGFSVAVLYPQQHGFLDMTVGIRHENPSVLQVFQLGLQDLYKLSDTIQTFAKAHDGERRCHGCERMSKSLKKCARCSMAWYCDKPCQTVGWKEKGHNVDCKFLRDPDLQLLLHLHQPGFDRFREFSAS